ncbi:MAG TPA: bifunctional phosphoribosylaminoimidazolecarboxamide formyltransferase/IMP cyclohydrolase [Gemmatimonadales bacterium]|nr:bifunctional phosphoribosylaminoimidazolecarboxamide formyltransferase/IMP cyclohydrolase [Gemmatimonadales bacterium]
MPRALISVSDKRGIVPFAQELVAMGWEILSTGGTHAALRKADVPAIAVETVTGFPEILDGRVKTLHPAIHAGLLARRDAALHRAALAQHHITPIDLLAVNLYPFRETVAKPNVTFEDAIENIDVGGPAMLRSAAKNHESVIVIVDPTDYQPVLQMLRSGGVSAEARRQFAAKVFSHTGNYDAAIAHYLIPREEGLPSQITVTIEQVMPLRYGENPSQRAGLYATDEPRGIRDLKQRQGKELSFNNLLDLDAAMTTVALWPNRPACAVIKHSTPCGVALGPAADEAARRAIATDPQSAFGGIVAFNTVVDARAAEALGDLFLEVVVAPSFHEEALALFGRKKNLRVVELPVSHGEPGFDLKRLRGGFLVQDRFEFEASDAEWKVVSARQPSTAEWDDLRFAWAAVSAVKSNAVLLAKGERTIGIGAGQMSRVDSSFMAVHKARQQGHETRGSVMASDAFFPFADGVDEAAAAGVTAIIQPGGSIRDAEVIAAADRHGMAMVFTGRRQFRH